MHELQNEEKEVILWATKEKIVRAFHQSMLKKNQKWVQEKLVKCFKDKPTEVIWTDKNHEVGEEEAHQGNIMYVCCGFSFLSWPENYLQHRYMFLRELCT